MKHRLRSLAAGLGCVFLAFVVTYLTWPLLQPAPLALFYAAVVAAALVGGLEGGLFAVALSIFSAYYAFFPPYWDFGSEPKQLVILSVFLTVASAFVVLIARHRRAVAREREQRRWFSATLSSVGDAVIATDTEGRVTFLNDVAEKLTGWKAQEAAGRVLEEVFAIFREGTREPTESPVKKALETGHIVGLANHTVLVAKDGTETAIEDSAAPIQDDEGMLRGVILVFRDASEKRRAELAAEGAHKRTEDLLRSITDGFIALNSGWLITYVNPQFERILGQKPGDVLGRSMWDVYPGLYESEFGQLYRRVAETGISGYSTAYYEHFRRWYDYQVYPAADGITIFFRDVTSRVEAEEEKRRLDVRRRLALDAAGLGSWNIDPDTKNLETDERCRVVFIGRDEPMTYEEAFACIHAEDRDRVRAAVEAGMRPDDPEPFAEEYRVVHCDGSVRWVLGRGRANFSGEAGRRRLTSFDGTVADITDRKRADKELRESEQRFRALVNATSDVVYRLSPDWSEMQSLDGRGLVPSTDVPIGDWVWMHQNLPRFEHERVKDAIRGAIAGKRPFELEHQVNRPDGSHGWTFSRAVPILDAGGDIVEWFGTASDVTRRKEAEEAMKRQAEQLLEADRRKDEFLAMLAHELRNPLAAIGNAVLLTTRGGLQEHVEWSMEVIGRQMKHLTHLIDDLLDVSRINRGKIELRRDVLDLTPILDSALATTRPLIEERKHTLDVEVDRGELWASVDPTRIEQVVVNLLNNAAKYSENGGHIRLSARNDGDEVVISVKDRGVGIPPEKLPQMFELFAQGNRSLARSEGGLGIGLTVVKKLVEMHGGSIAARSEGPGQGSEFTVRLTGVEKPASRRATMRGPSAEPSKAARILVVEDNVDTARGMARLLKLLGHDVAIAHDGPEGIEAAREHRPDFVLLDIGLPGMDGYEVAARLRREEWCKDAVIIAISGYGQDEDRRRSKEAGFDHHLIKPLDHDALLSLLSVGWDEGN